MKIIRCPPGVKTPINVYQSCSVVDFETMPSICQLLERLLGDAGEMCVLVYKCISGYTPARASAQRRTI